MINNMLTKISRTYTIPTAEQLQRVILYFNGFVKPSFLMFNPTML